MRRNLTIGIVSVLASFFITLIVVVYYQKNRAGLEGYSQQNMDDGGDQQTRIVIEEASSAEPEDLTRIEGIGPKTAAALKTGGITTYAQLASLDPDATKEILRAAGVRVAVSVSWSRQAALAAVGDWDGLAEYQGSLSAGWE